MSAIGLTLADAAAMLRESGAWPTLEREPLVEDTRPLATGWVYFVQMGDTSPIKIGFSVNVDRRLDSLQSCNPEQLHLRLAIPGSVWDEQDYHGDFHRSRIRGEWYRPTDDLLEFIRLANECEAAA